MNLTACGLCDSNYDYSDAQTCIDCLVVGCINCSASDQNNCTNCNQAKGYYNNITSWQCNSVCGDGIIVAVDEGCDDNNTVNLDGCSSACAVEPGFLCSGEPSLCFFSENLTLNIAFQSI